MLTSDCREISLPWDLQVAQFNGHLRSVPKYLSSSRAVPGASGNSLVCYGQREGELCAVEPQLCWKWQFVPLNLWGTRKTCV